MSLRNGLANPLVSPLGTNPFEVPGGGGGGVTSPGTTNLVSWYEFSESSGVRSDSHGSNHMTPTGSCPQAVGIVGNCIEFDGTNDLIYNTSTSDFRVTGSFSVHLWVYPDRVTGKQLLISDTGSTTQGWGVYAQDSDIDFIVFDGSTRTATSSGVLSVGSWHHVVCTFDASSGDMTIYVENSSSTPITGVGTITAGTGYITMGADISYLYDFDGRLDQVGFWDGRVLTSGEVDWLYNSGNGRAYGDLSAGAA